MKIRITKAHVDNPHFFSLNTSYDIENGDEYDVVDLALGSDGVPMGYMIIPPCGGSPIIVMCDEAVESEYDEVPVFDSPHSSVWIVAVDMIGRVSVLKAPNLHPGLSENGTTAFDWGLPEEVDSAVPGVYRWHCSFHEEKDWESGIVEDWHFEVEREELLYSIDQEGV